MESVWPEQEIIMAWARKYGIVLDWKQQLELQDELTKLRIPQPTVTFHESDPIVGATTESWIAEFDPKMITEGPSEG